MGSSIDTAKGVGVLAIAKEELPRTSYQRGGTKDGARLRTHHRHPDHRRDRLGGDVVLSVFTNQRTGHKTPIRHPSLQPKLAIEDPRLMPSMPPKVTDGH